MNNIYNIPEFLKYLNIDGYKDDSMMVVRYDDQHNIRLKSEPISIDFYQLTIKSNSESCQEYGKTDYDETKSFLFMDQPGSVYSWAGRKTVSGESRLSGYSLLIDPKLFSKYALNNNFPNLPTYNNHEALFLTEAEEVTLKDIFEKTYSEYHQDRTSMDILAAYARLILSYVNAFYERQFETRSKLYNETVADFYRNLETYYDNRRELVELPSVAYFADKSNHSPNYFGDVIKHFTGSPPLEIIHDHIIETARKKLLDPQLTVSQIGYSLGFEYPTYFSRFFKKKTGIIPKNYRNQ